MTKRFKSSPKHKDNRSVRSTDNSVVNKTATQSAIQPVKKAEPVIGTYTYLDTYNQKYNIVYKKTDKGIIITGFSEPTNTSEYCISKDGTKLVFDIKKTSSLLICDNTGKFTDITRPFYKTRSTGEIIQKQTAMSRHQGYIWAEKPYFTMDGRVIYISRLPFIRSDTTLYLWCENIDGTNYKNLSEIGNDKSVITYGGYDSSGRLIINIKGVNYYLDKGSYMLKR